jgi:hypothetical protein
LVLRRLKVDVTSATFAAAYDDDRIAVIDQVFDHEPMLGVDQCGANRNVQRQITSRSTMTAGTLAGATARRSPKLAIGKLCQTVHSLAGLQNDARPITAVATVGPTARHVLLAAKADTAVSASTSPEFDFDTINKHGNRLLSKAISKATLPSGETGEKVGMKKADPQGRPQYVTHASIDSAPVGR